MVIPESIISPQDIARLDIELRDFADWFGHNTIKQSLHINKTAALPSLSPAAITLLRSVSQQGVLTATALDNVLSAVRQIKDSAPTMTITLAAPPGLQTKQLLVAWCRQNIDQNMLVEFRFSAVILGGMIVRYGSRIFDWSFRRAILSNRDKFAEVLRHV